MTDVNGKPTNVTTSVNDAKVWLELGYILTEYVTRSQAEKLLAAKDILLDIAKQWARDQEDRANRLQADNAAKDARIEEYETGLVDFHREMSTLEAKLAAAEKALETADTAVTLADKLIERGYGSDTPREWHKVIVAAQKARAVLGGKP